MNIRPFDWRDLPILHRYRNQGLFFDSASVLTRGMMLVPAGALLSYFSPATGIFTYLCDGGQSGDLPLLGQVVHSTGAAYARLSFLAPESALDSGELSVLLDRIALHVGERGAFHILAEIDEHSPAFDALHRSGFADRKSVV